MTRISFVKPIVAATAILLLAACSGLPLPMDVDLKAKVPADSSEGTVSEPIEKGEAETLDLLLPTEAGECVDFSEVAPGVTVQSAKLQWIVDATYDGPALTGKVQARAYATGAGDEVFHSSNTLGPTFTLKLDRTSTRLAGAAVLNPEQLQAVNDREVCWGVEVTGRDLAALEDGTAHVHYEVKKLMLSIRFSVI